MKTLNKTYIISKLKELQPTYSKEGIILVGLFGSYARDEAKENSDIDILYDIEESTFLSKYPAFKSFKRLSDLKKELQDIFHKTVDIADRTTLKDETKQYISKDLIYAK